MLTAKSSRDINQAARSAAKYLKDELGVEVSHAKALDLVARTLGKPHHMAAQAGIVQTGGTAPNAVPDRTPQEYAIEHAGYLADAAKHLLERLNELALAHQALDESPDMLQSFDVRLRQRENAEEAVNEAMSGLRECIFEFQKRRDRATRQPANAAEVLQQAGVYKGAEGLERLAACQEFWDKQPYGTRLYFGDGVADYLHRDVLQTAVAVLGSGRRPTGEKAPSQAAKSALEDLCKVLTNQDVDKALFQEGISDAAYAALAQAAPYVGQEVLEGFPVDVLKSIVDDLPTDAASQNSPFGMSVRLLLARRMDITPQEPVTDADRLAAQFELATGESGSIARELIADNGVEGAMRELNKRYEIGLSLGPWLIANESEKGFWTNGFGWGSSRMAATGFTQEEMNELGPKLAKKFGSYSRFVKFDEAFDFED